MSSKDTPTPSPASDPEPAPETAPAAASAPASDPAPAPAPEPEATPEATPEAEAAAEAEAPSATRTATLTKEPVTEPEPAAAGADVAVDPRLLVREQGWKGYLTEFSRRIRGGELGSLPVIIGLVVIWGIFQWRSGHFLTADTLSNVSYFMVGTGMLSIGLVFVLLLGEIDLSVASISGLASAVFGVLSVTHGMNPWLALVLAILTGMAVGALQGWFFAKIGVPAFVVTLAGNLAWLGAMTWVLGKNGSINLVDSGFIHSVDQTSFFLGSDISGAYIMALVGVVALLAGSLVEQSRRRKAGVPFRPTSEIVLRTVVLAVVAFGMAYVLNQSNGVPSALVYFFVLLVVCDFVLRRTTYGRRVFAVGGSIEAARRAGISVAAVRITVFAISGTFAAIGGLFIAGTTVSAQQEAGQGSLLMLAIAAPVIGGTSLFGGRGSIWSALLGGLVIQSITTGLDLLNMPAAVQYMITGAVLLAAVVIDSVSRRTQKSAGRA